VHLQKGGLLLPLALQPLPTLCSFTLISHGKKLLAQPLVVNGEASSDGRLVDDRCRGGEGRKPMSAGLAVVILQTLHVEGYLQVKRNF